MHINVEVILSAGTLSIIAVDDPGAHGAVKIGLQGCGCNTPPASAVAFATSGLAKLTHWSKVLTGGWKLIPILLSSILAANLPSVFCSAFFGKGTKTQGAVPIEHKQFPVRQVWITMLLILFSNVFGNINQ